ncbi:class I SAM-dependent methyltransferase [Actinophytocola sp.]|uniref:class I SAM-dependent methyltransferase n=1 Tax=Actinophytocola sp. TaxID=1872138 RepID=UPI002D7F0373|nr:methyltransferase domain-containing protein [Actinophytocola sp.]HET9144252.1 methyltransferase domain-containing protein [Actinophytocola sp.]HEU5111236.1 methyltransferase domain-containing protein [Micromonosporaceae bacterium]
MSTAAGSPAWSWEAGPVLTTGPLRCERIEPVDVAPPFDRDCLAGLGLSGVQFGSLQRRAPGCLNVDLRPLTDGVTETELGRLVRVDGSTYFVRLDVCQPLPFAGDCVDWAYSEHLIEHVPLLGAIAWLTEVRRILAPGGLLRLTTPDLRRYIESYLAGGGFFAGYRERLRARGTPAMPDRLAFMVNHIFYFWDHRWIYDADELRYVLGRAGFTPSAMRVCAFQQGARPDVAGLDDERRNDETIYVEVRA